MNKKQTNKGFTLIELLVVIAIIGILASVVLVSFPGATKKAKDSRIVSAISQARTIMTYVYANEGSYSSFTCSLSDMTNLCNEVKNNNPGGVNPTINAGTTGACIYSALNAKSNYWYCADSTGVAGFTSTNPGTTNYCTGSTYVCPAVSD